MKMYSVVEQAGMDDEHTVFEGSLKQCQQYVDDQYEDEDEKDSLHVDIMLQRGDGSLTTEF